MMLVSMTVIVSHCSVIKGPAAPIKFSVHSASLEIPAPAPVLFLQFPRGISPKPPRALMIAPWAHEFDRSLLSKQELFFSILHRWQEQGGPVLRTLPEVYWTVHLSTPRCWLPMRQQDIHNAINCSDSWRPLFRGSPCPCSA
jgi:hypothetical protein